jgi:enediyne biosynthesis protein E4
MSSVRVYFVHLISAVTLLSFLACNDDKPDERWLFEPVPENVLGVRFVNKVENTEDFNIFLYRNFYNGGGVGTGDINNDGLPDVYFTSNMGDNALFLNKGNFSFEDITQKAGVASSGKWSTGVTFVDINADGWLDIYVCNAGYQKGVDQRNQLFINNKDLTFSERASEYGLDENGYTTHAAFFDYDKDGDLDVYILNNSFMPVNTLNYSNKRELPADEWPVKDFLKGGGDRLLRNDSGKFVEVTKKAGIYNSLIGFGLGISVGDVNNDGWEDIYVSNDFFERDYLYINNKNGTFKESIKEYAGHLSAFSMGADMGDINNDGYQDVFVTDMLPSDNFRLKTTTSFEDYNVHQLKLDRDFYHQYMQNTLQLNTGDGSFSEIANYSGVAATDWSWGALLFDVDNDGFRDVYVCNGIFHDVTNQDFIDFFANDAILKMALSGKKMEVDNIINKMPSVRLQNRLLINQRDLTFKDVSDFADNEPSFSNGASYADLDNDGDLDLVVNNVNQPAFFYKNLSFESRATNFIKVRLKGTGNNTFAVGARVFVYGQVDMIAEQIPSRGFQSSVDYALNFGLGNMTVVDSIVVRWPDLTSSTVIQPGINSVVTIDYEGLRVKAAKHVDRTAETVKLLTEIPSTFDSHREDAYVDFYNEGLIIKMISREGPKAAVGDVDGDQLEDVYFCGAKGQPGRLYIQAETGFSVSEQMQFTRDSTFEDTASEFFDCENDGDLDLIVGSGGNYTEQGTREMQDRLYINDGRGNFTLRGDALPNNGYNTSVLLPFDFDDDGDIDIFGGSRSVPGKYGLRPKHFLYRNDGTGKFSDVIDEVGPPLEKLGMVTGAALSDVNSDGKKDLVVIGEWEAPQVFSFTNGTFAAMPTDLSSLKGWWSCVLSADFDNDGDDDLLLGNVGENFLLKPTKDQPVKLWLKDFDSNGTVERIVTETVDNLDFPVHMKKELTQQIITLKKQNLKYAEYAQKSMGDLFGADVKIGATILEANFFKSVIAINDGEGAFAVKALPAEVQFSSINAAFFADFDGDNYGDVIVAGNFSSYIPQFGKQDASYGNLLLNDKNGSFTAIPSRESGFKLRGNVTQITSINMDSQKAILCLINNGQPKMFRGKFNLIKSNL